MVQIILFFVIMFAGFAFYYLMFLCSYFWEAKLVPEKLATDYVQVVPITKTPIPLKLDFFISDIEIEGISKSYKITKSEAIRKVASRRICAEIDKIISGDKYNQIAQLVEIDRNRFYSPEWIKERRYYIKIQLLPIDSRTENYDYYTGLKLVQ